MSDTDPLEQFHAWYDKIERLDELTRYSLAREAFFAGYASRPVEPRLPSRLALEKQRGSRRLTDYDYREPGRHPLAGPSQETMERVQRGLQGRTITGRPQPPKHAGAPETLMFQEIPPETFEFAANVWTGEPGHQMAQHLPPLPKPVEWSQHPRFEQHGTVSGSFDYSPDYGAPGPVPTPVDPEDG